MSGRVSVAVVTGAASGIGAAVARRLAADGYRVWPLDLNREGAEAVAAEIGGAPAVEVDVASPESVGAAFAAVAAEEEAVDALVLSAGVTAVAPFAEIPVPLWQRTLQVNVVGTYLCLQAALPLLRAAPPPARVVVVASSAGKLPGPFTAPYNASKAAQINLMRTAAVALAPGILVNAVNPGVTDTPMWADLDERLPLAGADPEWNMRRRAGALPIGRPATPEEVAAAVAFVASPAAGYMLGEDVNVNGGLALH